MFHVCYWMMNRHSCQTTCNCDLWVDGAGALRPDNPLVVQVGLESPVGVHICFIEQPVGGPGGR